MRRILRSICVSLLFFASFAFAAPMDSGRAQMWCGKFFGNAEWARVRDDDVERWSKEYLAMAHVRAAPIVCSGAPVSVDTVASQTLSDGFDEYFFIAINADFRFSIDDELRAIVAHEVAHLVTNRGVHCDKRGSRDGYELCEHAADKQADSWAGKGSMVQSLNWTARYLAARNGGNDEMFIETIRSVRRRIFLLR